MTSIFLKSLKATLISMSPLIIYIAALIVAPEATNKYMGIMSSFIFGISQKELIITIAVLGLILSILAFYDLYWKVRRNRKKIALSMPFEEIPSGKFYKQIYADMDKEMSTYTKQLTDIVFDSKDPEPIDPERFKFLLHLIVGFKERNPEILEDLNTFCKDKYSQIER